MKKADFLKFYARLSTIEILKILEEKEKYQPVAIEAAREILAERDYNNEDLNTARAEINLLVNKKKDRQKKIDKAKSHIIDFIDEYFGLRERSPEKLLNLFCVGLFLYTFISGIFNFRNIAGYFSATFTGWSITILIYLFELLVIYLLYKRSNWGWVIIVAGCIFISLDNIQSILFFFSHRNEFLFIRVNHSAELVAFFITVGIVFFLNTKKISEQFTISKDGRLATLSVSIFISAFSNFISQYI